jgi:dTDP-4-amino-4,6-dideoxygalactose transaminase
LDEIQAAILRVKLARLDEDNQKRREIAADYLNRINHPGLILPKDPNESAAVVQDTIHIWHVFVIRCKERDRLQSYLTENGVQTLIHYPIPPHKQRAYRDLNTQSFPMTETIHQEVLSLPISPVISPQDVHEICRLLNAW